MENKNRKTGLSVSPGKNKSLDYIYHKMIEEVEDYAILMIDNDGFICNWNKGAEKIKGYTEKEIIGQNFRVFYTKEDQVVKLPEQLLKEAKENGKAMHEGWRVTKTGERFWGSILITALHDENNNHIGYTKITRNLTERKLAQEIKYKAVIDSQEKERKEISNELHDNLGQVLASCKLLLDALSPELKENPLLKKCNENINYTLQELRNISHRISQDILVRTGISHALSNLAAEINQTGFISVKASCSAASEKNISPEMQLSLYRIVQEQLHNILKHSGAAKASISLHVKNKKAQLSISDDGTGFQLSKVKKGLGLQNIYDRAELYNGKVHIVTAKGKGCCLLVDMPITQQS